MLDSIFKSLKPNRNKIKESLVNSIIRNIVKSEYNFNHNEQHEIITGIIEGFVSIKKSEEEELETKLKILKENMFNIVK